MSLAEFATNLDQGTATVTVLNPERACPVYEMLSELFTEDAITVRQASTQEQTGPSDAVIVEKDTDEGKFAVSSIETIREQLLLVNSDIYVTGARDLPDVETPDVVKNLDEVPFRVRGYPENHYEKLLLIEISRHIEAMAWQAGEGHLKSGFQYLSRLEDEHGTSRVYERIGENTAVSTHVYGVPDADPDVPGVVHGEDAPELAESWFVVFQSDQHPHEAAALVAVETRSHTWDGCWTYDEDKVSTVLEYLEEAY